MTLGMRFGLRLVLALGVLALVSAAAAVPPGAPPASTASGPVAFSVNAVADAPADFTGDAGFTICRTNPANTTCTLRAAIMNANRHPGGAIITLPAGTYGFTQSPSGLDDDATGDLNISNTVTLAGAGAASTIVDGAGLDGVFLITTSGVVTITGVTIRGGSTFNGGGIYNGGRLSLADSVLTGNRASSVGGGLVNDSHGTATLERDTLEANVTGVDGGGLYNAGVMAINASTLANNSANTAGGLVNETPGHLTVFDSTISNNRAVGEAGGVLNVGQASFFHTTIAGNLADSNSAGGPDGGGLFNGVAPPTHTLELWNSLVQFNYAGVLSDDCGGQPLTSKDYNFIESSCPITGTTTHDVVGFDENLGSLADNGGPTRTRALFTGSRALDQIPSGLCRDPFGTAPVPDQRGAARPVNGLCDMGAYEGELPQPMLGRNLIVNGDAEASAGSLTPNQVGVPGWARSVPGNFTAMAYNAPGGFPSVPTDTVPANHGINFFAGGTVTTSIGSQIIALGPLAAAINAGRVHFVLSADLGGFLNQADNAQVVLKFVAPGPILLPPIITLGPVTAAQRGNHTRLLPVSQAGTVPAGAVVADIALILTRVPPGTDNDGYADNVALVLSEPVFLPFIRK